MNQDIQQFEKLFRQYQPRLFAFCCKYVDDKEAARDLVQECFINLWENRDAVQISFEAYLFTSVRNRSLSYIRSQRVRADYQDSVRSQIKEYEFHPEGSDPISELYIQEVVGLVTLCLNQLPDRTREIFMMSRYDGLKNKEIAEKLNISVRTVENQIYSALRVLKTELKDYLPILLLFI